MTRAHPTSSAGYCTGWGDPHYVTFDGLYYSYQGNCTYVLVEEVSPRVDNFGIYVDNYHCDVNDEVSCPRTLVVRHETQEVLIKTVQMAPIVVQVRGGGGPPWVHGCGPPHAAGGWAAPDPEPGLERCSMDTSHGPSGGLQGPLDLHCSRPYHSPWTQVSAAGAPSLRTGALYTPCRESYPLSGSPGLPGGL